MLKVKINQSLLKKKIFAHFFEQRSGCKFFIVCHIQKGIDSIGTSSFGCEDSLLEFELFRFDRKVKPITRRDCLSIHFLIEVSLCKRSISRSPRLASAVISDFELNPVVLSTSRIQTGIAQKCLLPSLSIVVYPQRLIFPWRCISRPSVRIVISICESK